MGAAFAKVLNNLFIVEHGEATTDSNLKKAKMVCMLSSTRKSPKPNAFWRYLELNKSNEVLTKTNLKAGAKFIHESRCGRENVVVIIEPNNHESALFIVTYFYILSGLPAKIVRKAVMKIRDKLEVTDEFDSIIESMQDTVSPKELRDELFKNTSGYTEEHLIEDLKKIYHSAELDPPTQSEIKLETKRDLLKRDSFAHQNSLNQMFKRLSVDITKQDTTRRMSEVDSSLSDIRENSINSSNQQPSPKSPISEKKTDKKYNDNMSGNDKHLSNHSSAVLNEIRQDLSIVNKSNTKENNITSIKAKEIAAAEIKALDDCLDSNITNKHISQTIHNNHYTYEKDKNGDVKMSNSPIKITYALSHESTEADAVDEYLRNTTPEYREKMRKKVKILHAYAKLDSGIDII
ncbi:unnamed protein product [Heterobilharzia americana]|nr:unnamed protein product [Heterobilharzia americana]CAH8614242.1 unnamed protein product [Heterobilharzia americana]